MQTKERPTIAKQNLVRLLTKWHAATDRRCSQNSDQPISQPNLHCLNVTIISGLGLCMDWQDTMTILSLQWIIILVICDKTIYICVQNTHNKKGAKHTKQERTHDCKLLRGWQVRCTNYVSFKQCLLAAWQCNMLPKNMQNVQGTGWPGFTWKFSYIILFNYWYWGCIILPFYLQETEMHMVITKNIKY